MLSIRDNKSDERLIQEVWSADAEMDITALHKTLLQFRPISLHPAPYRRVGNFQTAFFEQFFDVS